MKRVWMRDTISGKSKWHAFIVPLDYTGNDWVSLCGFQHYKHIAHEHAGAIAPIDDHDVCLHCLRSAEKKDRATTTTGT